MTLLLIFCVLLAGAWAALSVASRLARPSPSDSVDAHSRALRALAPARGMSRRPQQRRRPR